MVIDSLYGITGSVTDNRAELPFDLSRPIEDALQSLYKRHSTASDLVPEELFSSIAKTLNSAVSDDLERSYPQLADMIRSNNNVFAAFKVHDQCRRMAELLVDDEGKLRTFEQWRQMAEPIANHHNKVWLRTEYDTALKRANQAKEWMQFEDEMDVLPNLRWVPSTAAKPGADHMAFWNTVLPVRHPFWNEHRPGDRWGCQCSLESTDEPATEVPEGGAKDRPAPGLDNNPAKDGKLFGDSHPYLPKDCHSCPFYAGEESNTPANRTKDCANCSYLRKVTITDKQIQKARREYEEFGKEWRRDMFDESTGGYLVTHSERIGKSKKSKNEAEKFNKEHAMCINLAKAGYKVKLLKDGGPLGDCDITVDGILADLKKTGSSGQIEKYAGDTFKKKGGKIVVFEIESRKAIIANVINGIKLLKGQKIIYYYSDTPAQMHEVDKK